MINLYMQINVAGEKVVMNDTFKMKLIVPTEEEALLLAEKVKDEIEDQIFKDIYKEEKKGEIV